MKKNERTTVDDDTIRRGDRYPRIGRNITTNATTTVSLCLPPRIERSRTSRSDGRNIAVPTKSESSREATMISTTTLTRWRSPGNASRRRLTNRQKCNRRPVDKTGRVRPSRQMPAPQARNEGHLRPESILPRVGPVGSIRNRTLHWTAELPSCTDPPPEVPSTNDSTTGTFGILPPNTGPT